MSRKSATVHSGWPFFDLEPRLLLVIAELFTAVRGKRLVSLSAASRSTPKSLHSVIASAASQPSGSTRVPCTINGKLGERLRKSMIETVAVE